MWVLIIIRHSFIHALILSQSHFQARLKYSTCRKSQFPETPVTIELSSVTISEAVKHFDVSSVTFPETLTRFDLSSVRVPRTRWSQESPNTKWEPKGPQGYQMGAQRGEGEGEAEGEGANGNPEGPEWGPRTNKQMDQSRRSETKAHQGGI